MIINPGMLKYNALQQDELLQKIKLLRLYRVRHMNHYQRFLMA